MATQRKTLHSTPTTFDQWLQVGVATLLELRESETGRLSKAAYLREVLSLAGCDEQRLREVESAIHGLDEGRELSAFCTRTLPRQLYERHLPNVPRRDRIGRLLWFGGQHRDAISAQMATAKVTIGEVFALAVRLTDADAFGNVDTSSEERSTHVDALRRRLDDTLAALRQSWGPEHVVVGTATIAGGPGERERRLATIHLKSYPTVDMSEPTWPRLVVEHAARQLRTTTKAKAA